MPLSGSDTRARWSLSAAVAAVALFLVVTTPALGAKAGSAPARGSFRLVTYNVAGLPQSAVRTNALANLPIIGKLLNRYDIAVIQEDFAYPLELRRAIRHPYSTPAFERGERLHFGDGLSTFARFSFSEYVREKWRACHGVFGSFFDCLTPKGFARARQVLADGFSVDVYNLHMDAGGTAADRRARELQIEQLAEAILRDSAGQAVIVAGDTNIRGSERELLARLEERTGLVDSCRRLRCPGPWYIDRVLYRGGDGVELRALSWRHDPEFVDARGRPLSDHPALTVRFEWRAKSAPLRQASSGNGRGAS